jgi:hypothetical protein
MDNKIDFGFFQYWDWTQGPILARQALYHLCHVLDPIVYNFYGKTNACVFLGHSASEERW